MSDGVILPVEDSMDEECDELGLFPLAAGAAGERVRVRGFQAHRKTVPPSWAQYGQARRMA